MRYVIPIVAILSVAGVAIYATRPHDDPDGPPPLTTVEDAYGTALDIELHSVSPTELPGLHNVFRLSDNIVSGSEPADAAALKLVAEMGVKTIISVDGKAPDHETATELGMRYVHIPIQYRGITEDELRRIVKSYRELEAPFYVHCFHGRHRGPTAAAVGRLVLDAAPRDRALAEMRQWCGTSGKYRGLYNTVGFATLPPVTETRDLAWDFPARHPLEGFRGAMIEICRAHDHLVALSKRGWQADPKHPDVDPVNEADKFASLFERSRELLESSTWADDFSRWVRESAEQGRLLQAHLAKLRRGDRSVLPEIGAAFAAIKQRCDDCHRGYRNN